MAMMTREEILSAEGRALDALVAEEIFGIKVKQLTSYDGTPQPHDAETGEPIDFYSSDMEDADLPSRADSEAGDRASQQ